MATATEGRDAQQVSGNRPLNVLYLIDTLELGGTERSLLEICRNYNKEIRPIVCYPYKGSALQKDFESAGIECIPLGIEAKYGFLRVYHEVRTLAISHRINLIHTMLFRSSQAGRCVGHRLGIPVVSSFTGTPWDPIRFQMDPSRSRWKSRCLQFVDQFTARWVDQFHAVSNHARDANCNALKIAPNRVAVIPRGREIEPICRDETELNQIRESLGLNHDHHVVTYVGRMIAGKEHAVLIHAMSNILAKSPRARLLLVGDGPQRKTLEQIAKKLDIAHAVFFPGWRDDVADLLQVTDCFAFPSASEGLPGALIESMLAANAIVASDIAPVREMIDDGVSGRLFETGNHVALGDAVIELLDDTATAQRLGTTARIEAVRMFDQRIIVNKMQEMYRSLTAGHCQQVNRPHDTPFSITSKR